MIVSPLTSQQGLFKKHYTIRGHSNTVVRLVGQLRPSSSSRVVLVGHSLGAALALNSLSRLKKLGGVVISGHPPLTSPPSYQKAFASHPADPLFTKGRLSHNESLRLLHAIFAPGLIPRCFYRSIGQTDPNVRTTLGKYSSQREDEVAIVAKMKQPLAIIQGASDTVKLGYLKGLRYGNLWRRKIHVIQGAGHIPHWSHAREFNNLLAAFLQQLNTTPATPAGTRRQKGPQPGR